MKKANFRLLILSVALLVTGCKYATFTNELTYDEAEKYTSAREFSFDSGTVIEKVTISWIGDQIDLYESSDGSFSYIDDTDEGLPTDQMTHYYLDGTHLMIRFCASGRVTGLTNKKATIAVPENLDFLSLQLVSTDLWCTGLVTARNIEIATVSGDIVMGLGNGASHVVFDSVSGNAVFTFSKEFTYGVTIDSVSGRCYTTDKTRETGSGVIFELKTVSANVNLNLI